MIYPPFGESLRMNALMLVLSVGSSFHEKTSIGQEPMISSTICLVLFPSVEERILGLDLPYILAHRRQQARPV